MSKNLDFRYMFLLFYNVCYVFLYLLTVSSHYVSISLNCQNYFCKFPVVRIWWDFVEINPFPDLYHPPQNFRFGLENPTSTGLTERFCRLCARPPKVFARFFVGFLWFSRVLEVWNKTGGWLEKNPNTLHGAKWPNSELENGFVGSPKFWPLGSRTFVWPESWNSS